MSILKVTPIENPKFLNEAYSYGSAFSRGTKVEIIESPIGNITLYFVSGAASVNEKGESVHMGDLEKQIERMQTNIKGELESAGGHFRDIVISTTYVKPDEWEKAKDIVMKIGEYGTGGEIIWVPSDICRKNLLIEADALAVQPRDFPDGLVSVIKTYEENLLRTMRGLQLQKSCKMIPIGDLCYLFIFDYVENLEGNSNITSTTFKEKLQELYEGITADLSSQHTSWKNVVNARINLPQLLTTPLMFKKNHCIIIFLMKLEVIYLKTKVLSLILQVLVLEQKLCLRISLLV